MITGPMIAEIAALIGDSARATMVPALLDGRPLTASEVAAVPRITPQAASAHLAKLTAAGVLSVVRRGRQRQFRLASPTVADMIDGIVAVALEKRPPSRDPELAARAGDRAGAGPHHPAFSNRNRSDLFAGKWLRAFTSK